MWAIIVIKNLRWAELENEKHLNSMLSQENIAEVGNHASIFFFRY